MRIGGSALPERDAPFRQHIDGAGGLFVLRETVAGLAPPPGVPRSPVEAVAARSRRTPGAR